MPQRVLLALVLLLIVATGSGRLWGQAGPGGAPLTIEAVAADQRLWPREIVTKSAISTTLQGRTVTVPAGEILRVVRVEREGVVVQFQGESVLLAAAQTDLLAGANSRRVQQGIQVTAAPPVSAAPRTSLPPPPVATPVPSNVRPSLSLPSPVSPVPGAKAAAKPSGSAADNPFPVWVTPTPKNLSEAQQIPLTPKAQADRAIRNVILKEGPWILLMLGIAIAIAIAGKRFIDS